MKYNNYLIKIIKSFSYAFSGILYCIKNEINMRFHLVTAVFVVILSRFYNFSRVEYLVLFLTISSVFIFEIINTSIETLVNIVSPQYSKLAKITKDTAAGAVLISAIFSIIIGFVLFWDKKVLLKMFNYFSDNNLSLLVIILLAFISYLFIFKIFKKTK